MPLLREVRLSLALASRKLTLAQRSCLTWPEQQRAVRAEAGEWRAGPFACLARGPIHYTRHNSLRCAHMQSTDGSQEADNRRRGSMTEPVALCNGEAGESAAARTLPCRARRSSPRDEEENALQGDGRVGSQQVLDASAAELMRISILNECFICIYSLV